MTLNQAPPPPPLDDDNNFDTTIARSAAQQDSNIPLGWKPSIAKPLPVVKCTATKRDGTPCQRWSIAGHVVCYVHGGTLPSVRKSAEERVQTARIQMMGMTTDATAVLEQLMQPGVAEGIRLKAATEILDRSGLKAGMEVNVSVEITGSPLDDILTQLKTISGHDEEEVIEDAEIVTED